MKVDLSTVDAMFATIIGEIKALTEQGKATREEMAEIKAHFTREIQKQNIMLRNQDVILGEINLQTTNTSGAVATSKSDIAALKTDIESIKSWKLSIKAKVIGVSAAVSALAVLIKEGFVSIHHP